MTLPINITLPVQLDEEKQVDAKELYSYLRKLVYTLSTQLQITNQTTNGNLSYITNTLNTTYPFIQGSTIAGTANYTSSVIIARAINLLVFVSFDITWDTHTGTGNTLIYLPYFASESLSTPFIGVIEPSSVTFTASYTYLTGNIAPTTNTIQVNQSGSGQPTLALPLSAAGHLKGSIVYATGN